MNWRRLTVSPWAPANGQNVNTASARRVNQFTFGECPPLALKGPSIYACQCLLIVHDQTCRGRALTAEFDPKGTLRELSSCGKLVDTQVLKPFKSRFEDVRASVE